jgi:putative FmdB family regulatory protein
MPVYDFECTKCNKIIERNVKLSDFDKEQLCDECKEPMKRAITTAVPKSASWKHWRT